MNILSSADLNNLETGWQSSYVYMAVLLLQVIGYFFYFLLIVSFVAAWPAVRPWSAEPEHLSCISGLL